jgi:pimeloyl-ACP methyl ester carboxylesterase
MKISANGLSIEVDDQGLPGGPVVLLIMGLGMQLVAWPDELVQLLVTRGFRVIRFDNRDIGLSQHFDHLGVPNLAWAGMRYALHLKLTPPYALRDMAADAVGVLDALGIRSAHVCGASMGGMIAQHLAAEFPDRVRSATLVMTTTGARSLPQPGMAVRQAMLRRPAGQDVESVVAHFQRLLSVIGSPAYPPEPERLRERLRASVQRSWHPGGHGAAADGHHGRRRPHALAGAHHGPGLRDPRTGRPAGPRCGRPPPGAAPARRVVRLHPRHGARPAPGPVAAPRGRHRRQRGALAR